MQALGVNSFYQNQPAFKARLVSDNSARKLLKQELGSEYKETYKTLQKLFKEQTKGIGGKFKLSAHTSGLTKQKYLKGTYTGNLTKQKPVDSINLINLSEIKPGQNQTKLRITVRRLIAVCSDALEVAGVKPKNNPFYEAGENVETLLPRLVV